jgi:ABC-2 type transport system ATP-binding protein
MPANKGEDPERLIEVAGLRKDFGRLRAIDDVSFAIARGEVVGLVGPNGAGKSTTIHILLGLIEPTAGLIRLFGRDIRHDRETVLDRVNFTSPYVNFPARLTVFENLMVYARLYAVDARRQRVRELLEIFGVAHLASRPVARLSSGELARVRLCKALLNRPRLLLLDEPTANLDPPAAAAVKRILLDGSRRNGVTILYTSHDMAQVEELCDRVLFMTRGRIIANGTPLEVTRQILHEERQTPALAEAFLRIGHRVPHEAP